MFHPRSRCALAIFLLALALCSLADTIETDDGKTLTGKVIDQTPTAVTIEIRTEGMTFRRKVPAGRVQRVTRDAADGPGYYPLPLAGDVGVELTAHALSRALGETRKAKPQYVILVIDSNGGSGPEMVKIAQLLRDAHAADKDVHYVAYVKKALSAAAVLAMTCPQIYFAPDGVIGAVTPYRIAPDGTPANLEEKFASAARAQVRGAAASGGHSDLLLRGMMEPELALVLVTGDDGKPQVLEAGETTLFGTTPLKPAGRILTLTSAEAVRCGLAAGVAADVDAIHSSLGLSAWHKSDDAGWYVLSDAARHARQAREPRADSRPAPAGATAAVTKGKEQLKLAATKMAAAQKKYETLKDEYQKEVDAAQEEYKQAIATANSTANPVMTAQAASHKKNVRIKKANETFPAQIETARKAYELAVTEYNDLVGRLNRSLASGGAD